MPTRSPLIGRHAKHVKLADEAFYIGGPAAKDSYLRGQALLDVCARAGGRSIHPGYGFLSENAAFADLCKRVRGQGSGGAAYLLSRSPSPSCGCAFPLPSLLKGRSDLRRTRRRRHTGHG